MLKEVDTPGKSEAEMDNEEKLAQEFEELKQTWRNAPPFATPPPGTFLGIGITTQVQDSAIRIVRLVPRGPAEETGLRVGAIVRSVNGKLVYTTSEVVELTRTSGPVVGIEVRNPDDSEWHLYRIHRVPLRIRSK
jgi:C-terminal processing protease CtpA/Prc